MEISTNKELNHPIMRYEIHKGNKEENHYRDMIIIEIHVAQSFVRKEK
jgi:hypothetical protein